MIDEPSLDDILGSAPTPASTPAPEPAQPEPQAAPEPKPESAKPEPKPAAETPKELEGEDEDDLTVQEGDRTVPLRAYGRVRTERNDYKSQVAAKDTEIRLLREQIEEAKRTPPVPRQDAKPATPAAPPQMPNPVEDPDGYARWDADRRWDMRLDMSESVLRGAKPAAEVDEALKLFKEEAGRNPALAASLRQQQHPWGWMFEQAQKIKAQREIGDDPAAYRAKLEAEIRAQIAAEAAPPAEPTSARPASPSVPRSLANTRSAAPRSAPAFSGPPSLTDILDGR
jgi:hypothetical protein